MDWLHRITYNSPKWITRFNKHIYWNDFKYAGVNTRPENQASKKIEDNLKQDTSCGFHNPPESSLASVHKRFMTSWPSMSKVGTAMVFLADYLTLLESGFHSSNVVKCEDCGASLLSWIGFPSSKLTILPRNHSMGKKCHLPPHQHAFSSQSKKRRLVFSFLIN